MKTLYVSPTQFEAFDRCNRYWWFRYGLGDEKLREPDKGFLTFGTVLHAVIERYLTASPTNEGLDLYPAGWDKDISPAESQLIQELIQKAIDEGVIVRLPGIEVEVDLEGEIAPGVIFKGYADVVEWNLCEIQDHKTAKTFRYALTPDELRKSTQMLSYAMRVIEKKRERGEPLPPTIRLRHNVYSKDPENKKTKVTRAEVTPREVLDFWDGIMQDIVPNMLALRDAGIVPERWEEVPGPEDKNKACNAYGGCSFRGICTKQETVGMYVARMNPSKKPETKGPKKMSLLDSMRAKRQVPPASTEAPAVNGAPPSLPKGGGPFAAASAPAKVPNLKPSLPTQAQAASAKALPKAAAPEVEEDAQQPPPWAVGTCTACEGIGFTSTGQACRICDNQRAKMRGITSTMFNLSVSEEGISWEPKPEFFEQLIELGYPVEELQGDPVSLTAEGEPEVQEQEAEALEISAPVMSPALNPTKRGPGRPKKNEANVIGTEQGKITKATFVLMLGCRARNPESKVLYMEEVLASVGMEIAQQSNLKSYYEADIWRRRDALAGTAPILANKIQGHILIVNRLTKDNEVLVQALVPLAAQVFEADDFWAKE